MEWKREFHVLIDYTYPFTRYINAHIFNSLHTHTHTRTTDIQNPDDRQQLRILIDQFLKRAEELKCIVKQQTQYTHSPSQPIHPHTKQQTPNDRINLKAVNYSLPSHINRNTDAPFELHHPSESGHRENDAPGFVQKLCNIEAPQHIPQSSVCLLSVCLVIFDIYSLYISCGLMCVLINDMLIAFREFSSRCCINHVISFSAFVWC
jgi:hypothetical protein